MISFVGMVSLDQVNACLPPQNCGIINTLCALKRPEKQHQLLQKKFVLPTNEPRGQLNLLLLSFRDCLLTNLASNLNVAQTLPPLKCLARLC
jgi:hypothetical protein